MLVTVRAMQAELAGDHGCAAVIYADAARRWAQFTHVLEHAYALLGRGRSLARFADANAEQPLREARAMFERMGARPRINECDGLLAHVSSLTPTVGTRTVACGHDVPRKRFD